MQSPERRPTRSRGLALRRRGIEGTIAAVKFAARRGRISSASDCRGSGSVRAATSRRLAGAHSTEAESRPTPHPVIAPSRDWQRPLLVFKARTATSDLGGTMRLGALICHVERHAAKTDLRKDEVSELHAARYGGQQS